ncbi:MAG TPA: type II toxin-antitoxin system HicB family antitoxin [Candidatus Methanoperedens sp.]
MLHDNMDRTYDHSLIWSNICLKYNEMAIQYILTDYVNQMMAQAFYDKLEDGTFSGRIPLCKGVIAFGSTLRECEDELRSTLEDWILTGLKLNHPLPVVAMIDLNREPAYEPVGAV